MNKYERSIQQCYRGVVIGQHLKWHKHTDKFANKCGGLNNILHILEVMDGELQRKV
jgi:hypothetical protein